MTAGCSLLLNAPADLLLLAVLFSCRMKGLWEQFSRSRLWFQAGDSSTNKTVVAAGPQFISKMTLSTLLFTWIQQFGNSSVTSSAHRCRLTWTDCMFAVGLQVFVNPRQSVWELLQLVQIQLRLIGDRFPSTRQTVQSPCTNVINQRWRVLMLGLITGKLLVNFFYFAWTVNEVLHEPSSCVKEKVFVISVWWRCRTCMSVSVFVGTTFYFGPQEWGHLGMDLTLGRMFKGPFDGAGLVCVRMCYFSESPHRDTSTVRHVWVWQSQR